MKFHPNSVTFAFKAWRYTPTSAGKQAVAEAATVVAYKHKTNLQSYQKIQNLIHENNRPRKRNKKEQRKHSIKRTILYPSTQLLRKE